MNEEQLLAKNAELEAKIAEMEKEKAMNSEVLAFEYKAGLRDKKTGKLWSELKAPVGEVKPKEKEEKKKK